MSSNSWGISQRILIAGGYTHQSLHAQVLGMIIAMTSHEAWFTIVATITTNLSLWIQVPSEEVFGIWFPVGGFLTSQTAFGSIGFDHHSPTNHHQQPPKNVAHVAQTSGPTLRACDDRRETRPLGVAMAHSTYHQRQQLGRDPTAAQALGNVPSLVLPNPPSHGWPGLSIGSYGDLGKAPWHVGDLQMAFFMRIYWEAMGYMMQKDAK